jgi:hypothetical protein
MKIIESNTQVFPFGIACNSCCLKRDAYAAPLRTVISRQAEVFFEITCAGRILKNWIIVKLCPMDILGKCLVCHTKKKYNPKVLHVTKLRKTLRIRNALQ